jgi:hypothetical protein
MAAQNGSMVITAPNGRSLVTDIYLPDAVATLWTFNPSSAALAASQAQLVIPCDGIISDISMATAPTATGANLQLDSANISGNTIRYANFLAANPNRPKLRIPVRKGQILTALQF